MNSQYTSYTTSQTPAQDFNTMSYKYSQPTEEMKAPTLPSRTDSVHTAPTLMTPDRLAQILFETVKRGNITEIQNVICTLV